MEMAAHRPEKILGLAEEGELAPREDADLDQILVGGDPIEIFGNPEEGVEVAKTALAVLDVGLDQIARGALGAVTVVAP